MTLKEYYQLLEKHDWYYDYSDDHSVWSRGIRERRNLEDLAQISEEYENLYDQYRKHMFTGKPWNTKQTPKPKEPK